LLTLVFLEIGTTSHEFEEDEKAEKVALEEYGQSEAEKEAMAAS
jgi:hypothetical protein